MLNYNLELCNVRDFYDNIMLNISNSSGRGNEVSCGPKIVKGFD